VETSKRERFTLAERWNGENSSKKYSLLGYETWQKTKIFGEKTAAARSGPEW